MAAGIMFQEVNPNPRKNPENVPDSLFNILQAATKRNPPYSFVYIQSAKNNGYIGSGSAALLFSVLNDPTNALHDRMGDPVTVHTERWNAANGTTSLQIWI